MSELPTFSASSYTTNSTSGAAFLNAVGGSYTVTPTTTWVDDRTNSLEDYRRFVQPPNNTFGVLGGQNVGAALIGNTQMTTPVTVKSKLRIVRVFLVDPDERVPMGQRILHRSDEITTDATDQELFFGIAVNDLLKAHNEMRAKVEWEEKTSEDTKTKVGLKEIRIRDLIMTTTTIASF